MEQIFLCNLIILRVNTMSAKTPCGNEDYTFDLEPFKRIYPFKSRWYRNSGFCQHYLDEGKGKPMVMVHGNPTWSFYYRRLIERFRKDYRVVVPDHIGMGMSEKPGDDRYKYTLKTRIDDLERLMDKVGFEKDVTLVVHDWGGYIGIGWALRKPSRIARVVALNTAAFRVPRGMKIPLQLWVIKNLPGISNIAVQGFNAFAGQATKQGVVHPMPPNVKKGYLAPYDNWDHRRSVLRFVQDIAVGKRDESYPEFKWIDRNLNRLVGKPMLICWGMQDFVFNRRILKEWKKRFPKADYHKYKDGGHYILEDKGKAVGDAMEEFFEKNPV